MDHDGVCETADDLDYIRVIHDKYTRDFQVHVDVKRSSFFVANIDKIAYSKTLQL